MSEIKLQAQGAEGQEEGKGRINLRLAQRLAEKEQQEITQHLEQFHSPQVHHPIQYEQEKTQLQKYLDLPPTSRNKKTIKSIKAELSYLSCLQIQAQNEMPKELLAIMKRDIDMLTAVISKFVYPKLYPKGAIIEIVASARQSVKILLKGEVAVFEPINYKAFKNCNKLRNAGSVDTEWLSQLVKRFSNDHYILFSETHPPSKDHVNPESLEEEIESYLLQNHAPLPTQICRKILARCGIITPSTPHRQTRTVSKTGQLICSEQQAFIVSQSKTVQHTAICLTQTYVVQLEYNVYKAAISLLNSDEEKKYIQILLRKFAMLEYFDAKQYVKKEYMIDRKKEEQEERDRIEQERKAKEEANSQFFTQGTQKIVRENSPASSRSSSKSKQQEEELDIETYEIKYDSDIYLIVSGEATIIIDRIEETRASGIEHASKVRTFKSHPILKLYASDIFGFEQIGKVKEYNLRYRVNKNSKLLLLNQAVYIKQYSEVPGFKHCFKSLQAQRNHLLTSILKGLQKTIEQQQLRRYQSVASLPVLNSPRIKKVQFLGSSEFQSVEGRLLQRMAKEREGRNEGVSFKQIMEGGQLRERLKFASIYKERLPRKCEVVGEFVEVRGKDGSLKRRKCIAEKGGEEVFRKLGIISDEDRNNHNLALVSNRHSKYQLGDFHRDKKEMNRLKSLAKELPKLGQFFSKKSELLYRNLHKRDY